MPHDAACRDVDPELFFPIGDTGPALLQIDEAKQVCRRCPAIVGLPAELRGKLGKLELGMSIFCSESLPQFERAVISLSFRPCVARLAAGRAAQLFFAAARTDLSAGAPYHHAESRVAEMKEHYRCWAEIDRSALRHNAARREESWDRTSIFWPS